MVTFGRFNRQGTRMMVAVGHTPGMRVPSRLLQSCGVLRVEGGAREFRQALAKGGYGHHQAIIYGNHVKELQELGEIVGFEGGGVPLIRNPIRPNH